MSHQLQATLQFSNALYEGGGALPIFMESKGITGSLNIKGDYDTRFGLVKVVLEGTLMNTISNGDIGSRMPVDLCARENIFSIADVLEFDSGTPNTDHGLSWDFPIDFQLSSCLRRYDSHGSGSQPLYDNLPPSFTVDFTKNKAYGQARPRGGSHIEYVLKAWVIRNQTTHLLVSEQIQIYACVNSLPPPTCLEDFPGEYLCQQVKSLSRPLFFTECHLSLHVSEPCPVDFKYPDDTATAQFPVRALLSYGRGKTLSTPPPLDLRVTWALKTHTFVSVVRQHLYPTAQEALRSPFLEKVQYIGKLQSCKMQLLQWNVHSEKKSTWVLYTMLWLPVASGMFLSPSVFTPYVTRRYSVAMQLDVSREKMGKASFHLNVPVQIIYVGQSDGEVDEDGQVCDVPRYVP